MDDAKRAIVAQWIQDIPDPALDAQPLECDAHVPPARSLTCSVRRKRKHKSSGSEYSLTVLQSNPAKWLWRPENPSTEYASTVPSLRDDVTLTSGTSSQSQRSLGSSHVNANLKNTTLAIIYLDEVLEPRNETAKELLAYLLGDDEAWQPDNVEVTQRSQASLKCKAELRSQESWVIEVARPLLQAAIGPLPLECWSVQSESVYTGYQQKYTTRDSYDRRIDLTIGLPLENWATQYGILAAISNGPMSHIDHPHTGSRLRGAGFEVKASDGNLIKAEVQLGV
ncbi:hypothetical protein BJX99DRAFT_254004 [Aspergillus californicus]